MLMYYCSECELKTDDWEEQEKHSIETGHLTFSRGFKTGEPNRD